MQQKNNPGRNPVNDMVTGLRPAAQAAVKGSKDYPDLSGVVTFYPMGAGTMVSAAFQGLPSTVERCPEKAAAFGQNADTFSGNVLGFHIHEGNVCNEGTPETFSSAGGHYNPGRCAHPFHAGDMPPLFVNNGFAWLAFFTQRFTAEEVIGRTVIIHSDRDDFTTQPAGDAGKRIACGVIRRV